MRHVIRAFFLSLAVLLAGPAWAQDAGDTLRAAVDSSLRSPAFVARDAARHPYETLRFFDVQPDMTVLEISPGGGWYAEILAPYLRDRGLYIAVVYDGHSQVERYQRYAQMFADKLASRPAVFDKVKVNFFEPPKRLLLAEPGTVDRVLTFRNVHNWLAYSEDTALNMMRSIYDSLKPGGYLGVVEHRLPAGRKQDAQASSGYVHEDYVIALAEQAGFKLAARSEVNANPLDTTDYPNGVWALPPSYRNGEADKAKYQAIGESDRMTLKFLKP